MSGTSQINKQAPILGKFASIITFLSIALYFTGWIYRWAYFGFFRIQITSLDFPIESFFFIPIYVFLGNFQALIKAILILALSIVAIFLSHKFLHWRKFPTILSSPLIKELVIVAWILIALFWIARWEGEASAWRAASNNSSLLPVVTLIQPDNQLGLGYNPKDATYASLEKARVIGDVGLLVNKMRGREVKIPGTSSQTGDWRFLIANKGWIYLFQALPPNANHKDRPLVLAIREGDGKQLMILSPTAFEEKSP